LLETVKLMFSFLSFLNSSCLLDPNVIGMCKSLSSGWLYKLLEIWKRNWRADACLRPTNSRRKALFYCHRLAS